jgi:hypothetical protein
LDDAYNRIITADRDDRDRDHEHEQEQEQCRWQLW